MGPVTGYPPHWWLRPWRSLPGPRDVWQGLLRGCTPPPRRAAASPPAPATPEQPDPVQPGARLSRPAPGSLPRTSSGPPPRLFGAPAAARSPAGFQFRDEPLPPARVSGSQKPLSPPAARLPGRAGSSAPPAGEQPFPTCTRGTCRSAQRRKWPNPGAGEPGVRGGGRGEGGEGRRGKREGRGQKGRGEGFPGFADRAGRASEASDPAAGLARVRERRRWGLWEPPAGKKRGPASLSPQTRLLPVPQLFPKNFSGRAERKLSTGPGTRSDSRASAIELRV